MERFDPFFDERDEPQYAAYLADPEWQRIYSMIRRGYWHVTSVEGSKQIREAGAIKPNIEGRFPIHFDYVTQRSYGYVHNCVALFDFVTPDERKVIAKWSQAWEVMITLEQPRILFELDRERLEPKVIPNTAAWPKTKEGKSFGLIPFVEAWYPEDISEEAVVRVYEIPATRRFEFKPVLVSG